MAINLIKGEWSESAQRVLAERYLLKKNGEIIETPDEMCWRVASTISRAEEKWAENEEGVRKVAEDFYRIMVERKFMPNSPTLMNAGKNNGLQYSACYVLPIGDSMIEIFDAIKNAAIIHQSGGGTGFAFSRIRPKDSLVRSSGGRASGPVSFLKAFDAATEAVKQGGTRRGANMAVLRVDHPDIEEFINCKLSGEISNFNISVAITDEFMRAYEYDEEYELVAPHTREVTGKRPAREIFDEIAQAAWTTGDPGVIFIDRINQSTANPTPELGEIEATNPCVTGDTLVAVADGRDCVPIKQLAEEGKDVPVYCYGDGRVQISMGRNPRLTRKNAEIWKVVLDDGSFLKATPDHKFILRDGAMVELRNLKKDDSLMPFYKYQYEHGKQKYWRINLNNGQFKPEHILIEEFETGKIIDRKRFVVHHKNYIGAKWRGEAPFHNHKVVSIEFVGYEDVYNLTVDEFHNYAVISNKNLKTGSGNVKYGGIIWRNCGEQALNPWASCNLGSINLLRFVRRIPHGGQEGHPPTLDGKKEIDWDDLEDAVRIAVRFLDDVIDVNPYPLPEVDEAAKANRRIGLGIMGWADLLFALGIPYDSEEALQLAGRIMSFIRECGHDESAKLAEARGAFPNWSRSIYKDGKPLRNATITTIAPTGTVSIIAGCSSGIEPIFALAFSHVSEERRLTFLNGQFERIAKERGFYSPELIEAVKETGSVQNIDGVPEDIRRVFKIAHEIEPEWHVRMQAAFQKHIDNSVSKTVNLPNSATVEDVKDIYLLAHELGCMGITVFRDGCRDEQVLRVGAQKEKPEEVEPKKKRPRMLMGATYRTKTPVGTAYVTVNQDEQGDPLEVFLNIGKAGSDIAAMAEALGRLISLCLRMSSTLSLLEKSYEIIEELSGIGGSRTLGFGPARVLSLPDAVARVLAEHIGMQPCPIAKATESEHYHNPLITGDLCPDCGHATFIHEEGCYKCYSCGYSEC